MTSRVLILGGTTEAAALATEIDRRWPKVDLISSLAGRTRAPRTLPGAVRFGGFGGAVGLGDYLLAERIDLLIDATHPFASEISSNAVIAAETSGISRLVLCRPPWETRDGMAWHSVPDLAAAAGALKTGTKRAFLATGKGSLEHFAELRDVSFLVRVIDPPVHDLPLVDYTVVTGKPPPDVATERALMTDHGIDTLVTKNSGGTAGFAKVIAAAEMGLRTVMVSRPSPSATTQSGTQAGTVDQALTWLAERL